MKKKGIIFTIIAVVSILGYVAISAFIVSNQADKENMGVVDKLCNESITLNGKSIKLPTTLNKLEKNYTFGEKKRETSNNVGYDCVNTTLLYKGDPILEIELVNTSEKKLNRDSEINTFIINTIEFNSAYINKSLVVNGIGIGSTKDEVIANFREIDLANNYNDQKSNYFYYYNDKIES